VATPSTARRRGIPWWTPLLLLALLVAAVAGGIALGRDDAQGQQAAATAPSAAATHEAAATPAAPAARTPAATGSATLVAAGTALLPVPGDLARLVGRSARAARVPVLDVVGPRIFWVGPSRRDRLLVHLQGRGTRWAIRRGQLLSFRSIVAANRPGAAAAWGLTLREGARQLKRQGHHLEVYGPRIVFERR
jgi:hypothetical protein